MGTTGWGVMAILCVTLIAVAVWAIAALVRRGETASGATTGVGPEEILAGRLANGEIDVETYDALRAKLGAAA
jgi:uncharacterized membrane protein